MTEERFLFLARELGYSPVQYNRMGGIGFSCPDGSVHFVYGWEKCVEDFDQRPGFLTVSELLSCYHDISRSVRIA